MKTRIKLHLIIYIAFAGLFMACENEIPYLPKNTMEICKISLTRGNMKHY